MKRREADLHLLARLQISDVGRRELCMHNELIVERHDLQERLTWTDHLPHSEDPKPEDGAGARRADLDTAQQVAGHHDPLTEIVDLLARRDQRSGGFRQAM